MPETLPVTDWVIVIVDDQYDNVMIARTALEHYGAQVYEAHNGAEGLALLEQIVPTAVLLDLSMPVMNGWEMLRRMPAHIAAASVPIIAVTAHAMSGDRARVLAAGFDDYIAKPYDIHSLVPRIQTALGQKKRGYQHV